MENENPITLIKPNQPIVVKPALEVVTIKLCRTIVVKPLPAVVIQPKSVVVIAVQPARAVTVAPPVRGAWDERGWSRNLNGERETYEGYFAVGTHKFRGCIETRNRGRDITAYIYNPPREVKYHPHRACFQLVGDNWFHLHWSRPARNVDDAILYMERVLDESFKG
ncbi:MAG: hypothetical protein ACR2N3_00970 [Pyrinomonadaceae bacterium]